MPLASSRRPTRTCGRASTSTAAASTASSAVRSSTPTSPAPASSGSTAPRSRGRSRARATPTSPARPTGAGSSPSKRSTSGTRGASPRTGSRGSRRTGSSPSTSRAAAASSCSPAADFVSSPRFAPDARRVACLAWDHPSLPFLGTRLRGGAVGPGRPERHAARRRGRAGRVALPARVLARRSPRRGLRPHGLVEPLSGAAATASHRSARARPSSASRSGRSACRAGPSPRRAEIVCVFAESGAQRLARLDVASGRLDACALPYSDFEGLCCDGGRAAFVGGRADERSRRSRRSTSRAGASRSTRARSRARSTTRCSRAPEPLTLPLGGRPRGARLPLPPAERGVRGPARRASAARGAEPRRADRRHQPGSPARAPVLDLARLRAGGRELRRQHGLRPRLPRAPARRWGVVDVEDCAHAARFVAAEGVADPLRLSPPAGARAATRHCVCSPSATSSRRARATTASATSRRSRDDTHKFESRYTDWLVGPWPERERPLPRALAAPPRAAPRRGR